MAASHERANRSSDVNGNGERDFDVSSAATRSDTVSYKIQFLNLSKKALDGCLRTIMILPMARASAVAVQTTSLVAGFRKTLKDRTDQCCSCWKVISWSHLFLSDDGGRVVQCVAIELDLLQGWVTEASFPDTSEVRTVSVQCNFEGRPGFEIRGSRQLEQESIALLPEHLVEGAEDTR